MFGFNLTSSGKHSLLSLNLGEVPLLYILQASIQYFVLLAFNIWVIIFFKLSFPVDYLVCERKQSKTKHSYLAHQEAAFSHAPIGT